MPVDKWGKRAEIIVDADSTIKRMNIGRWYEQHINAAASYVQMHLPKILGNGTPQEIDAAWDYLMVFYKTVSPVMYDIILQSDIMQRRMDHLQDVIRDGIYLHIPVDSPKPMLEVSTELNQLYPDLVGPIVYRAPNGEFVTTVSDIMIGSMYIMLLEKTGNVWAAVDSSKLQHFGIPAKLTNEDKYSAPGREQPVRVFGESEVRSVVAIAGGDVVADILDQTNNPQNHKIIIDTILHADRPTDIPSVIDRRFYPIGNGRMQSYVHHFLECAGARFVRNPHTPSQ